MQRLPPRPGSRRSIPDDVAPVQAARNQALADRNLVSTECRVPWPDGSQRAIAMDRRGTFEPGPGKPLRMAGVVLDITERKRTEQRLQEVLRLEAIDGSRRHRARFNNMLVAILGFSDLLADSLQREDPGGPTSSRFRGGPPIG